MGLWQRLRRGKYNEVKDAMPFVCCVAYLAFLLYNSKKEQMQNEMKLIRNNLDLQLSQAVREIGSLRESQTLTRQYRHDMRHHLQYVSTCIENGEVEQAQAYISGICKEIEAQKVQIYCENEAVNQRRSEHMCDRAALRRGFKKNICTCICGI